jgi:hypothetical protein
VRRQFPIYVPLSLRSVYQRSGKVQSAAGSDDAPLGKRQKAALRRNIGSRSSDGSATHSGVFARHHRLPGKSHFQELVCILFDDAAVELV